MRKILLDIAIVAVFVVVTWFVYLQYGEQIKHFILADNTATMYLESTPLKVTIADDDAERRQGLSGVRSLGQFEGKLFIFSKEDQYSMWMKDMLFAIDIFWINDDMKVVHIEENVDPSTYPDSFASREPARFVLETNAFFAQNANVVVGDQVVLPADYLPQDLIKILQ